MEKLITYDTLRRFAYSNDKLIKKAAEEGVNNAVYK